MQKQCELQSVAYTINEFIAETIALKEQIIGGEIAKLINHLRATHWSYQLSKMGRLCTMCDVYSYEFLCGRFCKLANV